MTQVEEILLNIRNEQLKIVTQDHNTASDKFLRVINNLKDKLENILLKFLPSNMVIRYSHIDPDWICSSNSWVWKWRCEIVRSDFDHHSDFSFYWSAKEGIELNNSCIGNYNKKETGYIDTLKTMVQIWEHADEIEAELAEVSFDELTEAKEEKYQAENRKREIEKEIEEIKLKEFTDKIFKEGIQIQLQQKHRDNIFDSRVFPCPGSDDCLTAKITKVTPRKVFFDVCYTRNSYQYKQENIPIRKEKLINLLYYQDGWDVIEQ